LGPAFGHVAIEACRRRLAVRNGILRMGGRVAFPALADVMLHGCVSLQVSVWIMARRAGDAAFPEAGGFAQTIRLLRYLEVIVMPGTFWVVQKERVFSQRLSG